MCSYFFNSFILWRKRAFVLRLTTQMSSIGATILFSLLSAYQIFSLGSVLILSNSWLESVCLRWFIFSASICGPMWWMGQKEMRTRERRVSHYQQAEDREKATVLFVTLHLNLAVTSHGCFNVRVI